MPPVRPYTPPPSAPSPESRTHVWQMQIHSDETGAGWRGCLTHAGRIVIHTDLACTPNQVASELLESQAAFEDGELDLDEHLAEYGYATGPAPTHESPTQ